MADDNIDEIDRLPKSIHVSLVDFVLLAYSIFFHFTDVAFDIYMVYSYFVTGKHAYFIFTVVFIAIPSIIITLLSIKMYLKDCEETGDSRYAFIRIGLCILGMPIQSALVIRYCDSFWSGIKSSKAEKKFKKEEQKKFFISMMNENSDVALLKVFECYSESVLQQLLQITLLLTDYLNDYNDHLVKQCITIVIGFITMGSCMVIYNRSIRLDQNNKKNISILGSVVQFFWHLNFTVCRILVLSAMSVLNPLWTSLAVVGHWMAMTVWVAIMNNNNFCGRSQILNLSFAVAVGLIYVFNFVSLREGPTRKYYITFFSLCFVENLIAVVIWGVQSRALKYDWVYYIFLILPPVTFALSVLCIIIYYKYLHPNKVQNVNHFR